MSEKELDEGSDIETVIPSDDDKPDDDLLDDDKDKKDDDEEEREPDDKGDEDDQLDDEPDEKPKPRRQRESEPTRREDPPARRAEAETEREYTPEQWSNAYEVEKQKARAHVDALKAHMDGRTLQGEIAYEEMTPSQRRDFDKKLSRFETRIETLESERVAKVREVESKVQSRLLESRLADMVRFVGDTKPAFRNLDDDTREIVEGRYLRLLSDGRISTMSDAQAVEYVTRGLTPKKPASRKGEREAPRGDRNRVRNPDSGFRVRTEPKDRDADKGADQDKAAKSARHEAAVRKEYFNVMGYAASRHAEVEDLEEAIRRNRKKR